MNLLLNIFDHQVQNLKQETSGIFKKLLLISIVLFPLFQVTTLWFYAGDKVDESELVLFGVGFLGGVLDPLWNHYGHLGMYLLGLVYYIIGLVVVTIGQYQSITEYAAQFTFSGYFYMIARFFMGASIMLSVVLCAFMLDQVRCKRWLIWLIFLSVSISPLLIQYANYIRSDTLVALFTVCILYIATRASNYTHVLYIAVFTAAAIASKISAVTLGGVLAVVICYLLYKREIGWLKAFSVPIVCLILVQAFAPYMNYVDLISTLLNTENADSARSVSRKYFVGFVPRASQIIDFHIQALGGWVCSLSLFSVIAVFSKYKKIVIYSWLLIFLTLFPYWFGSTLRDYWFLPSYFLITFMAVVAAVFLLEISEKYFNKYLFRVSACSIFLFFLSGYLLNASKTYVSLVAYQSKNQTTNRDAAQEWLVKTQLGVNPILIDKNYSWVYPKIYDPSYLNNARYMSLLFYYERDKNQFLSEIFEKHLYSEYVKNIQNIEGMLTQLVSVRVNFHGGVNSIKLPKVCSTHAGNCYVSKIHSLNDIQVLNDDGIEVNVSVEGDDPYIIYSVDQPVPIDGTYELIINTDSTSWDLRYDFGEGFSTDTITKNFSGDKIIPIISDAIKPWANKWGPGEKWTNKVRSGKTVLFVTSSGPYGRFEYLRSKAIDPANKQENAGLSILSWHDRVIQSEKVKVFNSNPGSTIEIYNIAGLRDE